MIDAWELAGKIPANTREYYGQVMIKCEALVFVGEKGDGSRPVPYNEQVHKGKRYFIQVEIKINPLPEMQLERECKANWQTYNADWLKITMPSIRKLGFVNQNGEVDLKHFDRQWVKMQFIPGFSKNKDPEKPNYKTMEFLEVYPTKEACRDAYLAENGADAATPHTEQKQPQSETSAAVKSALVFVRSIAENAMKAGNPIPETVDAFLTQNVEACAGLKIDSPEIQALLKEFDDNPPF